MPNSQQVPVSAPVQSVDSMLMTDPTDAHGILNIPGVALLDSGEKRLTQAVLENGIHQLQLNVFQRTRTQINQFKEAEKWVFADDDHLLYAFNNCCHLLNIDPTYIRQRLREFIRKNAPCR